MRCQSASEAGSWGSVVEFGKARAPARRGLERRVAPEQPLRRRYVRTVEKAEHVFAGEAVDLVAGHARHSRSAIRERRIQDLTVPSGTPRRPANSPWLSPCT